ncbi:MAG: hypothetical protein ABEH65_04440 [Halobacteriales archaeon]
MQTPVDLLLRIEDWLRRPANRIMVLLAMAYLAVLGSLISYAQLSGGRGMPGQTELLLLILAILVLFYLMIYSTRA